mmetsp:Transcript_9133/g.11798  ORF Transcript_9133/g.11798 Transcript_9133/m.11798 type:complete len:98 (-) Transcript_9133:1153-1446(-)
MRKSNTKTYFKPSDVDAKRATKHIIKLRQLYRTKYHLTPVSVPREGNLSTVEVHYLPRNYDDGSSRCQRFSIYQHCIPKEYNNWFTNIIRKESFIRY